MTCDEGGVTGNINLENELTDSNKRVMAIDTGNILNQVGGSVQFGKRMDLFWVAMAIIASGVLITISVFGGKKRRR